MLFRVTRRIEHDPALLRQHWVSEVERAGAVLVRVEIREVVLDVLDAVPRVEDYKLTAVLGGSVAHGPVTTAARSQPTDDARFVLCAFSELCEQRVARLAPAITSLHDRVRPRLQNLDQAAVFGAYVLPIVSVYRA